MKKILALSALMVLAIASIAVANADDGTTVQGSRTHNDFSFTISSITPEGNTVYYNEYAVEDEAQAVLSQMGAMNVSVEVLGAYPNGMVYFPEVHVTFDNARATTTGTPCNATWKDVSINSWDGLISQAVFDGVKDHFDTKNLKEWTSGWGDQYQFHATMSALSVQ